MNPATGPSRPAGADDACLAAALFAVDPACFGGVALRTRSVGRAQQWLALLGSLLGEERPVRRVPSHIDDERLLGGLDLHATLAAGRPVASRGLLAAADGGVAVVPMAERMTSATVARFASVLDTGVVALQRDGLALASPARLGVVAIDEGVDDDEHLPAALADRLAFWLDLDAVAPDTREGRPREWSSAAGIEAAREGVARVRADDDFVAALCETAAALGVDSVRAPMFALRVARAAAALDGRSDVQAADAVLAARLVLAPRATRLPATDEQASPPQDEPPPQEPPESDGEDGTPPPSEVRQFPDQVLQAALSALPPGLLARLAAGASVRSAQATAGRHGSTQASRLRGRPIGVRQGEPRSGARLALVETLRAAVPWQRLRRAERAASATAGAPNTAPGSAADPTPGARPAPGAGLMPPAPPGGPVVLVRSQDFRVRRFQQRRTTTAIFVVDASGSAALHRMSEAKGAVERLLADCYSRRDRVALIAFRGQADERATLLLPPTRSLARAKRCLAGQAGGGGTPLACGLDAALGLALTLRRRGDTPLLVLLTDGRANVARDGSPGRARAGTDATEAARAIRDSGMSALLLDISVQPHPQARALADDMGATYLPLPHADAGRVSETVRAVRAG